MAPFFMTSFSIPKLILSFLKYLDNYMKLIFSFLLVLCLSHLPFLHLIKGAQGPLGLPVWLYYFACIHVLFIYLLYRYSQTIDEEKR